MMSPDSMDVVRTRADAIACLAGASRSGQDEQPASDEHTTSGLAERSGGSHRPDDVAYCLAGGGGVGLIVAVRLARPFASFAVSALVVPANRFPERHITGQRVVGRFHVACLLYTSPSPRDRS